MAHRRELELGLGPGSVDDFDGVNLDVPKDVQIPETSQAARLTRFRVGEHPDVLAVGADGLENPGYALVVGLVARYQGRIVPENRCGRKHHFVIKQRFAFGIGAAREADQGVPRGLIDANGGLPLVLALGPGEVPGVKIRVEGLGLRGLDGGCGIGNGLQISDLFVLLFDFAFEFLLNGCFCHNTQTPVLQVFGSAPLGRTTCSAKRFFQQCVDVASHANLFNPLSCNYERPFWEFFLLVVFKQLFYVPHVDYLR